MTPDENHCLNEVRADRREAYAALLFVPEAVRGQLAALEWLDIELSRIPFVVSQSMLGDIRLQWWHDALTGTGTSTSEAEGHPVLRVLHGMAAPNGLTFDAAAVGPMIDAYRLLLDAQPFADMAAVLRYGEARFGQSLQLRYRILPRAVGDALTNASVSLMAAARGEACRQIVEDYARYARHGACLLPEALLAAHGASPADAIAGTRPDAVSAALTVLRDEGERHIHDALDALGANGAPGRRALGLALLPTVLSGLRLRQLRGAISGAATPLPEPVYLRQLWTLWRFARGL